MKCFTLYDSPHSIPTYKVALNDGAGFAVPFR